MVISVLRVFDVSAMVAVIVVRLINGALFCAAGSFFTLLPPSGKTALMVFLLNPMLVQQGASLSVDVLVNSAAIAFVVYFRKLNSQQELTKSVAHFRSVNGYDDCFENDICSLGPTVACFPL